MDNLYPCPRCGDRIKPGDGHFCMPSIGWASTCPGCGESNSLTDYQCTCGTINTFLDETIDNSFEQRQIVPVCKYCGEKHGDLTICSEHPVSRNIAYILNDPLLPGKITTSSTTLPEISDLEELYTELGKLSWLGKDEGWDDAVAAIRAHIAKKLTK